MQTAKYRIVYSANIDSGYNAVPTDTGFRIYIDGINYPIWELNYDRNTDTLTDSTNGENEIYLFERK